MAATPGRAAASVLWKVNDWLPYPLQFHSEAVPNEQLGERMRATWLPLLFMSTRRRQVEAIESLAKDLKYFCLFVGFPRSGHSIFGSLLDAHPNMVIAHELDALQLVGAGFSRTQLFGLLIDNARAFAQKGRGWSGYSYAVPGQWQGRHDRIHVIGDKKGGRSTSRLMRDPSLLGKLQSRVELDLRIILYYRNPYDCLATMTLRSGQKTVTDSLVERFAAGVQTIETVKRTAMSHEVFEIRHEDLLQHPETTIRNAVVWLGEEAPPSYLRSAAGIVRRSVNKTRYKVQWTREQRQAVEHLVHSHGDLDGYGWDS